MLLIPYFLNTSNPNWITLSLFLCEGGRSIWCLSEDTTDTEIEEMLKDNGFPLVNLDRHDSTVYAAIDRSKLLMSDFYQWDEMNPNDTKDIWRSLQIPLALWSCPVFKEHFWKSASLPCTISENIFRRVSK